MTKDYPTMTEVIQWDITRQREMREAVKAKRYDKLHAIAQHKVSEIFGLPVELHDTLEQDKFYIPELGVHVFLETDNEPVIYGYVSETEQTALTRPADFDKLVRVTWIRS